MALKRRGKKDRGVQWGRSVMKFALTLQNSVSWTLQGSRINEGRWRQRRV